MSLREGIAAPSFEYLKLHTEDCKSINAIHSKLNLVHPRHAERSALRSGFVILLSRMPIARIVSASLSLTRTMMKWNLGSTVNSVAAHFFGVILRAADHMLYSQ